MIEVTEEKISAIHRHHGDTGRQWLETLDERMERISSHWQLSIGEIIPVGLYCNLVFRCRREDEDLILKIGLPEPELFTEMKTLQLWRGREHRVQVIDVDEVEGAILMPALKPGTTFRSTDLATRKNCLPLLHQTMPLQADIDLPRWQQWLDGAMAEYRGGDASWLSRIEMADSIFSELCGGEGEENNWVLHGDLHHENILLGSEGEWIAIDPKGIIGPRVMEYGRFMHNFINDELKGDGTVRDVALDRADRLADEFTATAILQAGFVDLIVSCLWTINGGESLSGYQESLVSEWTRLVS